MDLKLYFHSRQGEMLHFLKRLVELESPTENKAAVDICSDLLAGDLKRAGCRIRTVKQAGYGDLRIAEYPGGPLSKTCGDLLVLAHVDTVWPVGQLSRMPFFVSGDKVYGPGALDMKAGLVMVRSAMAAIHSLDLVPRRKIVIFLNPAEETGCDEAAKEIRKLGKSASLALCLEPALAGGALKLERKGRLVLRIETTGKPAHAADPEKGANAINELIFQLQKIKKAATGGTTINIGTITGGEKPNMVAEKAEALLDVRFWKAANKDKFLEQARALEPSIRGAKVKVAMVSYNPPMERTAASNRLFASAGELASEIGIVLEGGRTGGGSDASIVSGMGVPALDGLGPEGAGMHAEDEHLLIPSLVERTALLTTLLVKL